MHEKNRQKNVIARPASRAAAISNLILNFVLWSFESFSFARDGELVEPFRISKFVLHLAHSACLP
jgi:hypothetical protein